MRQTRALSLTGDRRFNHGEFRSTLTTFEADGLPEVAERESELKTYLASLSTADPDTLTRDEALAYWINVYNAGAISLAVDAFHEGNTSVLRVPGGFSRPVLRVADEVLSLDAIEHGKIRRFRDPWIHGALVCGSLSCPILRAKPYDGHDLNFQLDDQMRSFLLGGGAVAAADGSIELSRVFEWFEADFVRPRRMPTFGPAPKNSILNAVRPWLADELMDRQRVRFQTYDWGLACSVR